MCCIVVVLVWPVLDICTTHHSCSGFSQSQTIGTRHCSSSLHWEIFQLSKLAIFELLQQNSGHAACSTSQLYWDWSEREEILEYSSNILTEYFCLMLELFRQRWIMWHGVTPTFGLWILEKRPFTPPYKATHARSRAALLLLPRAPSVKWHWPVICITWEYRRNVATITRTLDITSPCLFFSF